MEFGVDPACVTRWRKQRHKIIKGGATHKLFTGPHKAEVFNLEVCEFVRSERCRGFTINAEAIQMNAMETAAQMQILHMVLRASRGWVGRMMRRNEFSWRRQTTICQKLPDDSEDKPIAFSAVCHEPHRENSYELTQIGNADETPVYFDMPK